METGGASGATRLAGRQHEDGSWGRQPTAAGRIVTTIFAARSLCEAGLAEHPSVPRALSFLTAEAVVEGGGSIDGTRGSVVPCYTGMIARLLLTGGRPEAAGPLVDWIVRYQPVTFGDVTYHRPDGPIWGEYLRRRYGGCMAGTTCLLGLVPTISALVEARRAGLLHADEHVVAMRRLLIDRRVMFGCSGAIFPLAGRTRADPEGTRWLAPAAPRDYVIDLIELVQLAVDLEVPAQAMREAVVLLGSWRLADGGLPMLGRRRLDDVFRPEPVNRRVRSDLITRRVEALGLAW